MLTVIETVDSFDDIEIVHCFDVVETVDSFDDISQLILTGISRYQLTVDTSQLT